METRRPSNSKFYPNHPSHPNHTRATNTINNHEQELPQQGSFNHTYNMKAVLSQCLAALAIFAVNFSTSDFALIVILFGQSDVGFDLYESYLVATLVGLIVGGVFAHKVGGRVMMIFGGLCLLGALLISQFDPSINISKWAMYIIALTTGIMRGPCYVYLAEISQPKMRSPLMATVYLSSSIGLYFNTYLLNITSSKIIIYINVIFLLFGWILLNLLPDSPYWLANKERYARVESSLAWFRGWTVSSNVKSESTSIIISSQINQKEFKLKKLCIPALIICYVFIIQTFIGINYISMLPLSEKLPLDLIIDREKLYLLLQIIHIIPLICFVFAVAIVGQRIMILVSLLAASIALFLTSMFGLLPYVISLDTKVHAWLISISLVSAIFFSNAGILQVPLLLNAELFPSRFRNIGAGIGLFFVQIIVWTNKLYIDSSFNVFGIIFALACVSMFGFVTLFWLFPRNENKTLVEIEADSNSIDSLRRKKIIF